MPHRSHARNPGHHRGAPAPAWPFGEAENDRRSARRVKIHSPLAVRWKGQRESAKIRLLDLSRSGFRFECGKIHSLEERGHAECIQPEGTRIDCDFVIVWSREVGPDRFQYGARFVKTESARKSA